MEVGGGGEQGLNSYLGQSGDTRKVKEDGVEPSIRGSGGRVGR